MQYVWWLFVGIIVVGYGTTVFKALRPSWRILKGDYAGALRNLEFLLRSRLSPRMRNVHLYNKANCQHRTGRFEESNFTLDQLCEKALSSNLRAAQWGLRGTNLVLMEKELQFARELLEFAYSQTNLSSFAPTLAYCELVLGNTNRADELVCRYLDRSEKRRITLGVTAILVTDKVCNQNASHFFLGLYFKKKGDATLASEHFTKAAQSDFPNTYSQKAAEILKATR